VGGIALIAHPFYGLAALSLVLAIFFAAGGIWKIFSSFSYRPVPGCIALLMSGALDLILGGSGRFQVCGPLEYWLV
jgi:uncharacterized membrane protein HdeD (DUF308 family)